MLVYKVLKKPSVTSCVHQASGAPLAKNEAFTGCKVKLMGTFIPICSMVLVYLPTKLGDF
jgi:hypothetical protein